MPIITKREFDQISETNRHVYFTFGRFQPPTTGHAALIEEVINNANLAPDMGDHFIVPTASYNFSKCKSKNFVTAHVTPCSTMEFASCEQNVESDSVKNPLPLNVKLRYLEAMFPHANFLDLESFDTKTLRPRTIFDVITLLQKKYTYVSLIVGSDRVEEFIKLIKNRHPEVRIFGLPDRETIAPGVSGTAVRKKAVLGQIQAFTDAIETKHIKEEDRSCFVQSLMRNVRYGLRIDDHMCSIFPDKNKIHGVCTASNSKGGTPKPKSKRKRYALRSKKS